jgi:hypothetical protein
MPACRSGYLIRQNFAHGRDQLLRFERLPQNGGCAKIEFTWHRAHCEPRRARPASIVRKRVGQPPPGIDARGEAELKAIGVALMPTHECATWIRRNNHEEGRGVG